MPKRASSRKTMPSYLAITSVGISSPTKTPYPLHSKVKPGSVSVHTSLIHCLHDQGLHPEKRSSLAHDSTVNTIPVTMFRLCGWWHKSCITSGRLHEQTTTWTFSCYYYQHTMPCYGSALCWLCTRTSQSGFVEVIALLRLVPQQT